MVKYRQPFDEKLTKVILVIKTDGVLYIQRKNNTRAKIRLVLFFCCRFGCLITIVQKMPARVKLKGFVHGAVLRSGDIIELFSGRCQIDVKMQKNGKKIKAEKTNKA